MDLKTWAKQERGRATLLAKHFNVSSGAISQWLKASPPRSRLIAIRDFTGGAVSVEEMVAPLSPNVVRV